MSPRLTTQEFVNLREFIHQRCGIYLGDDKAYLIEHRLARLMDDQGCKSFADLYFKAKNSPQRGNLPLAIVDAITTNETFWFRDPRVFAVLKEDILPELRLGLHRGSKERINIWSAACSTGQEPYSLAMTAQEFYLAHGGAAVCHQQVRILATDISPTALDAARKGVYDSLNAHRGLPEALQARYFRREGGRWVIKDEVKSLVEFKQHNLREPLMGLGMFDVVALRNVVIYFSEEVKRELFTRLTSVLSPGGYCFLGTGETLGYYTRGFEMLEHQGLVYYRFNPRQAGGR